MPYESYGIVDEIDMALLWIMATSYADEYGLKFFLQSADKGQPMGKPKDICAELRHDPEYRAGYEEQQNLLRKRRLFDALKDIAAVLAHHGAPVTTIGDDSVAREIARAGTSHLKIARDRFQMSTDPKKR